MFHELTPDFSVAGQLTEQDLQQAAAHGFKAIINNRPDAEEAGQMDAQALEQAALKLGLIYCHIPVRHGSITMEMIDQTAALIEETPGPVLAFCRSGARSTTLWALAQAKRGVEPQTLVHSAAMAGYDLMPMMVTLDSLKAHND